MQGEKLERIAELEAALIRIDKWSERLPLEEQYNWEFKSLRREIKEILSKMEK